MSVLWLSKLSTKPQWHLSWLVVGGEFGFSCSSDIGQWCGVHVCLPECALPRFVVAGFQVKWMMICAFTVSLWKTAFYAWRLAVKGAATSEKPFVQHSIVHLCSGAASTSSCQMQLMEKTCMTPHLALWMLHTMSGFSLFFNLRHNFSNTSQCKQSLNLFYGHFRQDMICAGLTAVLSAVLVGLLHTKRCFEAVTWKQKLHCRGHKWKVSKSKPSRITHLSYLCIEATPANLHWSSHLTLF